MLGGPRKRKLTKFATGQKQFPAQNATGHCKECAHAWAGAARSIEGGRARAAAAAAAASNEEWEAGRRVRQAWMEQGRAESRAEGKAR